MKIYDLSQAITNEDSCSFTIIDRRPSISYEEGESHGFNFITSCVSNLHSNIATHLDFPGFIPGLRKKFLPSIGEYSVDRFVGRVVVLDFSEKVEVIRHFFDETGKIKIDPKDGKSFMEFLILMSHLEISAIEIEKAMERINCDFTYIKGILIYSGLSSLWQYKKFESWEYLYFFNPYLSQDANEIIIRNNLSFIGIDALQIENPISNFGGDELPLVLNKKCRDYVYEKLRCLKTINNHTALLSNDILIYENLNIASEIVSKEVGFSGVPLNFQIEGLNDNALVRPYAFVNT
jgi:kynurenine formamidase